MTLDFDAFAKIVDEEFENILAKASVIFKKEMRKIVVRTLWDSKNHDRYGEYFGVPATACSVYDSGRLPSEIVIFARPIIEDAGNNIKKLRDKIKKVILHEMGHHLGLSEIDLRKRGIF